jgi:hypothetical protein
MRLRIAEIDQDAVAHIFGDKAGEAGDGVGDAAMIGAENLAQILGVVARCERRRADQIAEHYGQLAALGFRPRRHPTLPRMRGRVGWRAGARRGTPGTGRKVSDRFQQ